MAMRISANQVREYIQSVCYSKHLLDGYHDGCYTLPEVIRYYHNPEIGWDIECIPDTPKRLDEVLNNEENITQALKEIMACHTHSEPDEYGQCTECGTYVAS